MRSQWSIFKIWDSWHHCDTNKWQRILSVVPGVWHYKVCSQQQMFWKNLLLPGCNLKMDEGYSSEMLAFKVDKVSGGQQPTAPVVWMRPGSFAWVNCNSTSSFDSYNLPKKFFNINLYLSFYQIESKILHWIIKLGLFVWCSFFIPKMAHNAGWNM